MDSANRKVAISEIKIRPMGSADVRATLSVGWAKIPQKGMLASQLESRLDQSLVARHKSALVGFLLGRLTFAGLPIEGVGTIFFIAVKPEYQGSGIGSKLIDEFAAGCKSRGIETIRVLVSRHDQKTQRYFEKVGFHPSDITNYDRAFARQAAA
jgi:ribosomal protein S18 acetylase RimI-like enzyme